MQVTFAFYEAFLFLVFLVNSCAVLRFCTSRYLIGGAIPAVPRPDLMVEYRRSNRRPGGNRMKEISNTITPNQGLVANNSKNIQGENQSLTCIYIYVSFGGVKCISSHSVESRWGDFDHNKGAKTANV
ncbi:hypothetical protein NQ317_016789 [Molorchus minor]|uniref:Secreted protein n=1 Tax=Molorchus minor TaxID=1323400 RepID=A0ABQ9ITQ0_9CUCU|nr:hypothetical protein NQ317_016789 [Molorchus minor]